MATPTPSTTSSRSIGLQRALLAALALALVVGFVPAGIALDRRLAASLEARARMDLALAPRVLAARASVRGDALMMRAKDLAHDPAVGAALAAGDSVGAGRALAQAALRTPAVGALPLLVRASGRPWVPAAWWTQAADSLLARTQSGEMPVAPVPGADGRVVVVALAPVTVRGVWEGAAGFAVPVDSLEAATIGALTRSDVVVLGPGRADSPTASTLDLPTSAALADAVRERKSAASDRYDTAVHEVVARGRRWFVLTGALDTGATDRGAVVFARDAASELALLPELRRGALLSGLAALVGVMIVGTLVARRLLASVRALADAADSTAAGDFATPLPATDIREVRQVSRAFTQMRGTLDQRLRELETANAALAEHAARMIALQAELIQRDRLASAGRLVSQLAHEIRNPVASLRNCLELLRRRVVDDPEAREFADLAIDELLRMHELAEQMLDVHRPRSALADASPTDCASVARDVATLANLGDEVAVVVTVRPASADRAPAAIPHDALKQVLLNLVQNAREAMQTTNAADRVAGIEIVVDGMASETVAITVLDAGPGIADDVLARVFDPFFTTKSAMHGVGLGLFVAEGIVRGAGGRISAGSRPNADDASPARGAWFRIELPRPTTERAA